MAQFIRDYNNRSGGFQVHFDGTNQKHFFDWMQIIQNPTTFMLFGAPLSTSRAYDSIFYDMKDVANLNKRYLTYYDHFLGDVNACLCLQNAYLSRKIAIVEASVKKKEKKE